MTNSRQHANGTHFTQDNCYWHLQDTRLKYHLLKKKKILLPLLSSRWIQKQNYTDTYAKDKQTMSGFPLNWRQDLWRAQFSVIAANSISPARVIYCPVLRLPVFSSIYHKQAVSSLLRPLKGSREKVPEVGLLIFMGFFSAPKIHSRQTAQNIPHNLKTASID